MRVAVLRLYEAIKKTAWRYDLFAPERVRHEVAADGSHRIELTLRADEVEYELPRAPLTGAALLGPSGGSKSDAKE